MKEISTIQNNSKNINGDSRVHATLKHKGKEYEIHDTGNGPIDAFSNGIRKETLASFKLLSYEQHALDKGSASKAATYIQLESESGKSFYGVGIDANTSISSFKAITSALNRISISS